MNRIDRLVGLLTTLQSRKYTGAEQLSKQFEISIRTVYRDLKALGEIGIPIGFEPNKGYFIMEGYFLPPVTFTADEANALTLLESLTDTFGNSELKQYCQSAFEKIKAVQKHPQKEKLERLKEQIKVYNYPAGNNIFSHLAQIQSSITNATILKISYENNEGIKSTREVEPIGLSFYGYSWHLIAWCWQRNAYRDFNTSRIKLLENTGKPFGISKHITMNEYIASLE